MSTNAPMLVVATMLLVAGPVFGQVPGGTPVSDDRTGTPKLMDLFQSGSVSDVLQITVELRKAAESLERFGKSVNDVSAVAADAANSASRNLAAIGGEFDPFGFKTAFQTIQQQNAVIQAQHQIIMELQQKEIERLQQLNRPETRSKRQPRRRRTID